MPQDIIQDIKEILDIHAALVDKKSLYDVMSSFSKSDGEEDIPKDVITLIKEIKEIQDHIQRLLQKEAKLKAQLKEIIDKLVNKDNINED